MPHYYNIPNNQNVSLFKEKNECRASGSKGATEAGGTSEFSSAYSITDNIAIASAANFVTKGSETDDKGGFNYKHYEGSVGFFKDFENSGIFEVYGGVGFGDQTHYYTEYIEGVWVYVFPTGHYERRGTSYLSHLKYFIQPSYGFTFDGFDMAITSRFSDLYFNKISNDITTESMGKEVEYIRKKRNFILFEPGFTIRGGWKYLKLQLNYCRSFVLSNANPRFSSGNINIGLAVTIARRFWR